jgi:hypothetical protein
MSRFEESYYPKNYGGPKVKHEKPARVAILAALIRTENIQTTATRTYFVAIEEKLWSLK